MRPVATLLLTAFASLACEQLIGIEDAHYDDSLEPAAKAGTGEGGSAGEGTPCDRYCDAIMSACQGEQAQYGSLDVCLAACAAFPEGSADPTDDNSVSCRSHQAELAMLEPLVHCTLAGPSGNGECGETCEGFCSIMMTTCTAETSEYNYPDEEACLKACQDVPDDGKFSVDASAGYASGGTIQCRIYHVSAATQDPKRHCPHALGYAPCW